MDEMRKQLVELLDGGHAHMTFDQAVADFPPSDYNGTAANVSYTFWHLLEHIRITQWDILDFVRNPKYKEMKWPDDYWPEKDKEADEKIWKKTITDYKKDLAELKVIVSKPKTDFLSKIPHGQGQNILREMLLVADHNSYHIGEFAILRQVAQNWPDER